MVDDVFAEAVRKAVEDRVEGEAVIIPVTRNNGLRLHRVLLKIGLSQTTRSLEK